jgi:hypothetical protein
LSILLFFKVKRHFMRLGLYHTETDGIAIRYVIALQYLGPSFYRLPEFFQCEAALVIIAASAGGHQVLNGVEVYTSGGVSLGEFEGYKVVDLHIEYRDFRAAISTVPIVFVMDSLTNLFAESLALHH